MRLIGILGQVLNWFWAVVITLIRYPSQGISPQLVLALCFTYIIPFLCEGVWTLGPVGWLVGIFLLPIGLLSGLLGEFLLDRCPTQSKAGLINRLVSLERHWKNTAMAQQRPERWSLLFFHRYNQLFVDIWSQREQKQNRLGHLTQNRRSRQLLKKLQLNPYGDGGRLIRSLLILTQRYQTQWFGPLSGGLWSLRRIPVIRWGALGILAILHSIFVLQHRAALTEIYRHLSQGSRSQI